MESRFASNFEETLINKNKKHSVKLVFIGNPGVGKTSLIMTWIFNKFPTLYESCIFDTWQSGMNYRRAEIELQI